MNVLFCINGVTASLSKGKVVVTIDRDQAHNVEVLVTNMTLSGEPYGISGADIKTICKDNYQSDLDDELNRSRGR